MVDFPKFTTDIQVQAKSRTNTGLGRSIIKDRFKGKYTKESSDEPSWAKLRSVTHEQALEEFLSTAKLAGTEFTARKFLSSLTDVKEKKNIKVVTNDQENPYLLTREQENPQREKHKLMAQELYIPRRPKWDKNTSPAQLAHNEREAFLEWRRHLASHVSVRRLQEQHDLLLTPFERNLEVWRQLWRVIERSDLIVQIVDGRNPLLFRSPDLVKYVFEVNPRKRNLLLVNKADLMTSKQRSLWAAYFKKVGIRYSFFSARLANEDGEKEKNLEIHDGTTRKLDEFCIVKDEDESTRILTVHQLEELFLKEASTSPPLNGNFHVGLVGYPNVGKSSTINALLGAKRVSVSATPGKTKHFQTIHLSSSIVLCDCPGLVFPNFASTKAELVVNGILPIDQLRESTGPCALVAKRIPKRYIEAFYGITVYTKPVCEGGSGIPTAEELLVSYAKARGYTKAGQGNPDESRAARYILKDFVNGKLVYVQPPPDYEHSPEVFNEELHDICRLPERKRDALADEENTSDRRLNKETKTSALDSSFFKRKDIGAVILSKQGGSFAGKGNTPMLTPDGRYLTGRKARMMDAVSKGMTLRELNEKKKHFMAKKCKKHSGWGISE